MTTTTITREETRMKDGQLEQARAPFAARGLSEAEIREMKALGVLNEEGHWNTEAAPAINPETYVPRYPISAPAVLNEAYSYARPSAFTRGLKVPLGDVDLLFISGTASVGDRGETVHEGDFRAQCWRTFRNITELLKSEGATWHDVVRTSCYLRDIDRDYKDFNEIRTLFYHAMGLDPLPASTGIQAGICRHDLLVEIEAIAIVRRSHQ